MTDELVPLCAASSLADGDMRGVEHEGFPPLLVAHVDGEFHVVANTCSHGEAMLSDGYLEKGELECPFHSGRFCLRTGAATASPALLPIRVYRAVLKDGQVCVTLRMQATKALRSPMRPEAMVTHCACGMTDVHTHVVPEQFPRYMGSAPDAGWPSMEPAHACHRHVMVRGSIYRTVAEAAWSSETRRRDMEAQGVGRQVLSPMPELLSYWMSPADGDAMCEFLNETIATMVAADPVHFSGLGAVPLQDMDRALRMLERVVGEWGLSGVEVAGNIEGVPIGAPRFAPFFEAAERCGAAVFVHPLRPAGMDRLVGPKSLEQVLAFPGEGGLAAASMITGGTLAARPGLRIAFSHGGGAFQALLPRLQHAWTTSAALREQVALEPRVAARSMFYDTLVYDRATLAHLLETFGDTQLMVGTDYPFAIRETDPGGRLAALDLPADTLARLQHGNAARWLGLSEPSPRTPDA